MKIKISVFRLTLKGNFTIFGGHEQSRFPKTKALVHWRGEKYFATSHSGTLED